MKRIFLILFSMWITITTFAQISQVIDAITQLFVLPPLVSEINVLVG